MKSEIKSRLVDLDALTGPLLPGELMLVGGRPNSGKSVFAVNIAMKSSWTNDGSVVLYSTSESSERIVRRLWDYDGIPNEQRQKDQDILSSNTPSYFVHITAPGREGSLMICDHDDVSVADIDEDLQDLKKQGTAPSLLIIDYLHLLRCPEGTLSDTGESVLSANVVALKKLAVSINVPILLMSTVNRIPLEQRRNKRPLLSDLPVSSEAIAHADSIILLYRDELYSQIAKPATENVEIHVVKSKQGNLGTANVCFRSETIRFENPLASVP